MDKWDVLFMISALLLSAGFAMYHPGAGLIAAGIAFFIVGVMGVVKDGICNQPAEGSSKRTDIKPFKP